jgi:uncharacterized membrane protein
MRTAVAVSICLVFIAVAFSVVYLLAERNIEAFKEHGILSIEGAVATAVFCIGFIIVTFLLLIAIAVVLALAGGDSG